MQFEKIFSEMKGYSHHLNFYHGNIEWGLWGSQMALMDGKKTRFVEKYASFIKNKYINILYLLKWSFLPIISYCIIFHILLYRINNFITIEKYFIHHIKFILAPVIVGVI